MHEVTGAPGYRHLAWLLVLLPLALYRVPQPDEVQCYVEIDFLRALALLEHGDWPARGPYIARSAVTLDAGWSVIAAGLLALDPDPAVVHWAHVGLFILGLGALFEVLRRDTGLIGALTATAALIGSAYTFLAFEKLWHPGLLAGTALCWIGFVFMALHGPSVAARGRWLAGLWALQLIMLQAHIAAVLFIGAGLLATAAAWRVDRLRGGKISALLTAGLLTWTITSAGAMVVGVASLAIDGRLDHYVGASEDALVSWVAILAPADTGIGLALFTGVSLLSVVGAVPLVWRPGTRGLFRPLMALTLLGGLILVGASSGSPRARYLHALVAPMFLAAGYGASVVARWPAGRVAVALVALGSVVAALATPRIEVRAEPTLAEQKRAADVVVGAGQASWQDLETRVHGLPHLPGIARYLAHTRGARGAAGRSRGWHLSVLPEGVPVPAGGTAQALGSESGRGWFVSRHPPPVVGGVAQVASEGDECAVPLPWFDHGPLTEELERVGHRARPGPAPCLSAATIELRIPHAFPEHPATLLVVSDGGVEVRRRRAGTWDRVSPLALRELRHSRLRIYPLGPADGPTLELQLVRRSEQPLEYLDVL